MSQPKKATNYGEIKRKLPNQQRGRRVRQRLTTVPPPSNETHPIATCTSTNDSNDVQMNDLQTVPLLLPMLDVSKLQKLPNLPPNVQYDGPTNSSVISPVHTGVRAKGFVRPPPSKKETTDNLDPSLFAALSAEEAQYKESVRAFERNHNVHTPPQDPLISGHQILRDAYRWHHGKPWTADEDNCLFDCVKELVEHPIARKQGEKKTPFWKSVQIAMQSSRSKEAICTHFKAICNNKMKEKHPRHGEFCALYACIDSSRVDESDSTKKGLMNRFTKQLDMKAKTKAQRKKEKDEKKEQLDKDISNVCHALQKDLEIKKSDESEEQWIRRNIQAIRNAVDHVSELKENHLMATDLELLQMALISHPQSIAIEYERLVKKHWTVLDIVFKLIELAKLMDKVESHSKHTH